MLQMCIRDSVTGEYDFKIKGNAYYNSKTGTGALGGSAEPGIVFVSKVSYQIQRRSSKVTIDNIRRILSSFFSWLEDEDFIVKR